MRLIATILLLFAFNQASAQPKGKVLDSVTARPIAFATISSSSTNTLTQSNGEFSLRNPHIGDSIKVSCIGYKTTIFVINLRHLSDSIVISLQRTSIVLNPVTIIARHNYKTDSLRLRQEYASIFNHKAPGFKDVFISKTSSPFTPGSIYRSNNSSSQIVSINLLSILALTGKNKTPVSKLQKALLRDEEATFTDRIFSAKQVTSVTKLTGDSLQKFMETFRPSLLQLKKMSAYDLMIYIKNSYNEFINHKPLEDASPK